MGDMKELGRRLTQARDKAKLSRKYVAGILEVSVATLSHWETGKNFPEIPRLLKMANLYGCSVDWLLGRPVSSENGEYDPTRTPVMADIAFKYGLLPQMTSTTYERSWTL